MDQYQIKHKQKTYMGRRQSEYREERIQIKHECIYMSCWSIKEESKNGKLEVSFLKIRSTGDTQDFVANVNDTVYQ